MSELSYWKLLTRRKTISDPNQHTLPKTSKYKRLQLPNIGIATSFGIGIFAIIGFVARNVAGPSVIVCVAVAALISFLSGTFYAELSSRITRNASTYTYIYVCIGEFQAFIVGWSLILEYIIGVAIVSDSIGLHVDTLLNDTIKNSFSEFAPIRWNALADYFDFIAFAIPILFGIIVNIGLKRSNFLNKLFFVISVAVMLFVVIAGAFRAEPSNWYTTPNPLLIDLNQGIGGFAPFNYFGILRGIAVCVYLFIGFDVTGTGTRWKSLHGIVSFIFGSVALIGIGTVVTLAQPFYLLNEHAQLPQIFNIPSWYTAYYIIAIGGIIVLFASMYGLMYSMQITVLAMAKDSLLPKSFDSDKPIIEILSACLIAGMLAGLFQMAHLIDMLSIGIIFGFMAMAFAVVMFRYSDEYEYGSVSTIDIADSNNLPDKEEKPTTIVQIVRQLFNNKKQKKPTDASYAVVKILLVGLGLVSLGLAWLANFAYLNIYNLDVWAIVVTVVLLALLIIIIFLISLQPMRKLNAIFMVPFVPLSPAISIVVTIYLMMSLHYYAWIRFGIWIIFGLFIYFVCIVKYNRRSNTADIKSNTLSKNGFKNHGFVGDIERHPSFSFNSQSQMTYKSDDITETENENVDQSKIPGFELENEIPISPKSMKKSKAPIPMSFKTENQIQTEPSIYPVTRKSRTPSPSSNKTLDDIVLISEVIDTLTEMKEPNGKTYFVDEIRASAVVDTPEESEQKTAIEYLDDVLKKEEVNDDNVGAKVDENGISTSVVAVIHLSRAAVEEPQSTEKRSDSEEQPSTADIAVENCRTSAEDNCLKENEPPTDILNDLGKSVSKSCQELDSNKSTDESNSVSEELPVSPEELPVSPEELPVSPEELPKSPEELAKSPKELAKPPEEFSPETIEISQSTVNSEVNDYPQTADVAESSLSAQQNDMNSENSLSEDVHLESIESPNANIQSDTEGNDEQLQDGKQLINDQRSLERNEQIDSNSETPMTFKERLAMLLGQQPVAEVRRVSPRPNNRLPHHETNSTLKHSKSEPDIFNSSVMQGVFKDIQSKYELSDPDGSKKQPLQMTATGDIQIDDSKPTVPVPPKFDPFLYNTLGSRHNPTRMALTIGDDNDNDDNEYVPKPPMTAPIIMDNDHHNNVVMLRKKSSDDDDQTRMISIKDRLENILKRGPPDRYSRPKSMAPPPLPVAAVNDVSSITVDTTKIDSDKIDEDNQEVIRIKEAKRPFDTVHKQKVLFNDVLKSIGVQTRPSVIRANSITKSRQKPATIEDARNALKHVRVDWEKNVN